MIVVHGVLTRVKKSCWVPGTINLRTRDNEAVQSSLAVRVKATTSADTYS
jgi:hypothetical protein